MRISVKNLIAVAAILGIIAYAAYFFGNYLAIQAYIGKPPPGSSFQRSMMKASLTLATSIPCGRSPISNEGNGTWLGISLYQRRGRTIQPHTTVDIRASMSAIV
jgi:hypothetical protein